MLLAALAASGNAVGRDIDLPPGKQAGELLERVIEQYQKGELEGAWEPYRAFFNHPGKNNVSADAFGRCFYQSNCPGIGVLGSILQKQEESAVDFRDFCPDWNGRAPLAPNDENLGESERSLWRFRYGAMNGTCEEWAAENAAWFDPLPSRQDIPEQALLFAPVPDAEMGAVAGGGLASDFDVIGGFITKVCQENGEGTKLDITISGSEKEVDAPVGGFDFGGGGVKISVECGSAGDNSSDEGNDDENEDEKVEERQK